MPKRVDPDLRREQVADAVIDEIDAHGLRTVTLARIAARSGLAVGSIRHYFGDTLGEVMRFTLSTLIRRAVNRNPRLSGDPATRIADVITFVAPTNEQERKENAALLEYRVMARTDPALAAEVAATASATMAAIRSLLVEALPPGSIEEEALDREVLHLHSLVEGFSFSAGLSPRPLREEDVRAVAEAAVHRVLRSYAPARDGDEAVP
ncbi:TetR/AcrR family transcriptional regulator [Streptomyces lonarensis]|uniref:TetR family transcriptional regulator n=1 Tax=Streptomyces lonarensis TaxID=700599 RepID=A0A7X6HXD5_9ACTN|nr:TetR/AcrR family transcriptional regulator [Streptomyces lonarensis]NJQ04423.1 TetR family transcriptional regulator [Streptomyces lonarensis]